MKRNKKGFTIVEIVIVIAVIAILAAVLIPTFSGVIDQANKSKAMQAARNEYELFVTENAQALTGNEDYLVVVGEYAFKVEDGQFNTEALEKTDSLLGEYKIVTVPENVYYTQTEYNTLKGVSLDAEQFAKLPDAEKIKTPKYIADLSLGIEGQSDKVVIYAK